jgi:hypothetical protein
VGAFDDAQMCGLFAVDVAGFTRPERDDDIQAYIHEALYEMLQAAFDRSGMQWHRCVHEDRGDGALIVMPAAIGAAGLIDPLLERLRGLIRRHNRVSCAAARIQLRAAAHIGFVQRDSHGFVGDAANQLFRLLDAPTFKRMLAESDAELAFIASDYLYQTVIRRHPALVDPGVFHRVNVRTKQARDWAWVYLPGARRGSRYG